MKTLLTTFLFISLANLFADHTVKEQASVATTHVSHEELKALPILINPGNVIAIRPLTLKEGVKPEDFERFVVEDFTPTFEEEVPGVRAYILKGERGDQKGDYSFALIFDSVNTRDFYYPFEHGGEASVPATAQQLWMPAHKAIFERLIKYVTGYGEEKNYTDYVVLGGNL